MTIFRQIAAVLGIGIRTIPNRAGASVVIVIGMACTVGAIISILSITTGLNRMVEGTARPDRAVVMSKDAQNENSSSLPRANLDIIADAPGVEKYATGKPMAWGTVFTFAQVTRKKDDTRNGIMIMGIPAETLPGFGIRLISGRMFQPGKFEIIVGRSVQNELNGLTEGSKVLTGEGTWTVVGTFESGGSLSDSSAFADGVTMMSAMKTNNYKSVGVKLTSPEALSAFRNSLTANPQLSVKVERQTDYMNRQFTQFNVILTATAFIVGGIMGLGAIFGALNTMYSAVSARSVEIATLRALGFSGLPVMISVLAESFVLALTGALIGLAFSWIMFNGNAWALGGLVLSLAVSPGLMLLGLVVACVLGFLGGFFPALRAARRPIVEALRAI